MDYIRLEMKYKYFINNIMINLVFAFLIGAGIQGCSSAPPSAVGVITYLQGEMTVDGIKASKGEGVVSGNKIQLSEDALSVIQYGESSMIVMKPGTAAEVMLENADDYPIYKIIKGSICFIPVKNDGVQKITCGQLSSESKKSMFEVYCSDKSAQVISFNGKSSVILDKKGVKTETKLKRNERFELFNGDAAVYGVSPDEKQLEDFYLKFKIVNTSGPGGDRSASGNEVNFFKANPAADSADIVSLKRIERKNGPLWIVETKKGKKFIGHVTAKKDRINIITADGNVEISQKDIKSTGKYNAVGF